MTAPSTPQVDEILETLMAAKVDGSGNEQDKAIAKAAINLLRIQDRLEELQKVRRAYPVQPGNTLHTYLQNRIEALKSRKAES